MATPVADAEATDRQSLTRELRRLEALTHDSHATPSAILVEVRLGLRRLIMASDPMGEDF